MYIATSNNCYLRFCMHLKKYVSNTQEILCGFESDSHNIINLKLEMQRYSFNCFLLSLIHTHAHTNTHTHTYHTL